MFLRPSLLALGFVLSGFLSGTAVEAAEADSKPLADALKAVDTNVYPAEKRPELARMLADEINARRKAANERSTAAWREIKDRESWEQFRDKTLDFKKSLAKPPEKLAVRVTKRLEGEGHKIECVVFESRPGLWVTANLYTPAEPRESMPGILICHSHHNPKTEGELQDMGVNWARQGCLVLVMDQLGHGERRQHPFASDKDYPKPFRPSRQDYWFRFNSGMQLALIGEDLIHWMAWDLMRGVDLLLARPGIDPKRIILLGAVAGGGDPVGLAGALDPRIACVGPFNFGGPQPESPYPLPEDAETRFNYGGGGSWESTRNMRDSLAQGFLPWVVVGSIAPRRLIYAHEFSWDQARDPVWKRFEKIYAWEGAPKNLSFAHGKGVLSGKAPEASHCNNIGPIHRAMIYPALKEWFGIPIPEPEVRIRRTNAELLCLDPPVDPPVPMKPLHAIVKEMAQEAPKKAMLAEAKATATPVKETLTSVDLPGAKLERLALTSADPGIVLPVLLLSPQRDAADKTPLPVVLCVSQGGTDSFLKHEAAEIAALVASGTAVCLVDVRGTGETRPGDDRGRNSSATSLSATEFMLGRSLSSLRLGDLKLVREWIRTRPDLAGDRVGVWGASHAPVNGAETPVSVPMEVDSPKIGEPLGADLALGLAANDKSIQVVLATGGLVRWDSVLDSPFIHIPHDAILPRRLAGGWDVDNLLAELAPRPVRVARPIDGLNRAVTEAQIVAAYPRARRAYEAPGAAGGLSLAAESPAGSSAKWLAEGLRKPAKN